MPDGTTIYNPKSTTKKLMAPPRANFQEVYAAGERLAARSMLEQYYETKAVLEQFGTYDFQRDKATNTWFGRLWWAVVAAFLVLLVAFGPELLRLGMLLAIPWNCDEGMASDWRAVNARGDIVAAYAKACTGVGTVVDYSVVLQPRGADKVTTLVEHSELYYGYPKFRWIDDDALSIDLGNVRAVWGEVDRVGSIRIAYSYSKIE